MGIYASKFRNDDSLVSSLSHPSKADWITAHATASGLAIVEVERLWHRFQQLGCTDEGELKPEVLDQPPASTDIFVKNILTVMRSPNSDDGNITFLTFLNAMTWAENASVETKIRAIFHLVNNGSPITRDILIKVLRRLYPNENDQNIQRTASVVMQELDSRHLGCIEEEAVVSRILRMPPDLYEPLLAFDIIPNDINSEAHRAFTAMTQAYSQEALSARSVPSPPSISKQIPSDAKLEEITQKIYKRDWRLVANKLGLTSQEISQIETTAGRNAYTQCLNMLKSWRSREGSAAYAEILENALRDSRMNDAALLLQP